MHLAVRLVAACAAALLLSAPVLAQSGPTGSLEGHVLDPSRLSLPGVTVMARHSGTGDTRTAVTNEDGFFRMPALAVGDYTLTFHMTGFRPVTREGVRVEAAVPRSIDTTLEVGGLTETVTVKAEAPILQTSTAAVSRQLSGRELMEVPSSTRNFTHLLTATTGASADLPPVSSNDAGSISPSVNGTKTTSNSVLYNGVDITSLLSNSGSLDEGVVPAPETLEEVKLQTSLYSAATGRSGGGNFQLVTRSGGNTLRGPSTASGSTRTSTPTTSSSRRRGWRSRRRGAWSPASRWAAPSSATGSSSTGASSTRTPRPATCRPPPAAR